MKRLDVDTGAARVRNGLQSLLDTWEEASEEWNDSTAEAFHRERLEPIVPIVKNVMDAIARMRTLMLEARRDLDE